MRGGRPLFGKVSISGAKNSALPLMAASLLTKDEIVLDNVPRLSDIVTMSNLLMNHGTKFSICGRRISDQTRHKVSLQSDQITNFTAPYDIVRKMRASVWVMGPLLARFGHVNVSLPGGCAIGARPIDLHLKAMEELGAEIILHNGYIEATAKRGLVGAEIVFEQVSVGATANAMMAATLASGKTLLKNAAMEPEMVDLAELLNKMGAKISGAGTREIEIEGMPSLHGATHSVVFDRIEAGMYAAAAVITGGEIIVQNVSMSIFDNIAQKIRDIGAEIRAINSSEILVRSTGNLKPLDVATGPYPEFPTDMQAQLMALLAISNGDSTITENIFENRYMHVPELNRMGANILTRGGVATVHGVNKLYAAEVMATDLRASGSLVLAGLVAEGETVVNRVYHLDRGYEKLEEKLGRCGADIWRVVN